MTHVSGDFENHESHALSNILNALITKENTPRPSIYIKNTDVNFHIQKVNSFIDAIGVKEDKLRIGILLSSLDQDVQYEIFCQSDYSKDNDYRWICNKFVELFKTKQSSVTPLIKLLEIKQKYDQSLRDYISQLRITAYRLMSDHDVHLREKYLVVAFLTGLFDEKTAIAVRSMDPDSLDKAYSMVKHEQKNNPMKQFDVNGIIHKGNTGNEFNNLINEVKYLKQQLAELKSLVRDSMMGNKSNNNNASKQRDMNFKKNIICHNCEKPGHFVRDCKIPIRCKNCNKNGHITKYCRAQDNGYRKGNVRNITQNVGEESDVMSNTSESSTCINNDFFVVSKTNKKKPKKINAHVNNAELWADYVKGNSTNKPSSKTLITSSNSEVARNKPIIRGKLEGFQGKFFLDSGADINIIDSSLLKKIQARRRNILVSKSKASLRCANGSTMTSLGEVRLDMKFGETNISDKFIVIDSIFPRVFIGLRTLKKLRMNISPEDECAYINNDKFPFISTIDENSVINQGNMRSQLNQ